MPRWAPWGHPARAGVGSREGRTKPGVLPWCLQGTVPPRLALTCSPLLPAGDAFVLPIRIHAPAPGLTQCLLACVCTYFLKTRPGWQCGPGKRARPQARLTWAGKAYARLQAREGSQQVSGCHSSQDLLGGWREGVGGSRVTLGSIRKLRGSPSNRASPPARLCRMRRRVRLLTALLPPLQPGSPAWPAS